MSLEKSAEIKNVVYNLLNSSFTLFAVSMVDCFGIIVC